VDSIFYNLSNGILFVNFRVVDWKICFLQVCRYLKGFESNLNQNRPGLDTWLFLIGPYRFVRINDEVRRILSGLDVPD
jgi:hypothetical protein